MRDRNPTRARIITLGACAVCAQTLFVRELLGIVTGTELVLGSALASFLFWTGAGGLIGGRVLREAGKIAARSFAALSLALAFAVPFTVMLIRIGRSMLVDPPGSIPDLIHSAIFIFAAAAPFGLLYGAVYNSASRVMKDRGDRIMGGISAAYVLEASGSVAGGVMLSLLLFAFLTQLEASLCVTVLVTFVFLLTSPAGRRTGWMVALCMAVLGLLAAPGLDRVSMSIVFRGHEVTEIVPSRYAELCVTRDRETVSVFSGGARLLSHPDREGAGERVHIPLLAHDSPSRILMIGGGPAGGVGEALSHPGVESVDWIELDGKLSEALERAIGPMDTGKGARELTGDGRFFLGGAGPYDVIILNVPDPLNLRWNRYFTAEFFESARRSLAPGGVLSVRHGSSENFLSTRNAAVLGIVRSTLRSVFEYVDMVPGGTVFFLASERTVDAGEIPARLEERGMGGRLVTLDELPFRLSRERREYLEAALGGAPLRVNTDRHPLIVPYELVLHGWKSGTSALRALDLLLGLPPWALPALMAAAAVVIVIVLRGGSAAKGAVFLMGMSSMTVQLSVMLAYQAFSGVLYHTLVILTALFMAGAALGAGTGARWRGLSGRRLGLCHMLMAAAAAAVPLWLGLQGSGSIGYLPGAAGFTLLSLAGGFITGTFYRTAVETCWPGAYAAPALFYSWDLFGACTGGLVAGTLLIPLSGLVWTAAAVAAINCTAALVLPRKTGA
jgi:spermidine synthase